MAGLITGFWVVFDVRRNFFVIRVLGKAKK